MNRLQSGQKVLKVLVCIHIIMADLCRQEMLIMTHTVVAAATMHTNQLGGLLPAGAEVSGVMGWKQPTTRMPLIGQVLEMNISAMDQYG